MSVQDETLMDRQALVESVLASAAGIRSGFVRALKVRDEGRRAGLSVMEIEELIRRV